MQFETVNRLTFEGGGYLDGQGASWWSQNCANNDVGEIQFLICPKLLFQYLFRSLGGVIQLLFDNYLF